MEGLRWGKGGAPASPVGSASVPQVCHFGTHPPPRFGCQGQITALKAGDLPHYNVAAVTTESWSPAQGSGTPAIPGDLLPSSVLVELQHLFQARRICMKVPLSSSKHWNHE